jgi:hypothetical protein
LIFCEMANRVDRIRNSRPCNLNGRDCESGIFSNRQAHHLEPISRRRPGSSCLMRWNRRGNEKNAVEIKGFSDLLRAAQMAPMDRIEGAAEEPDPHRNSISPFAEPSEKDADTKPTSLWQAQPCKFLPSKRRIRSELGKRAVSWSIIRESARRRIQQIWLLSVPPNPSVQRREFCSC